MPSWESSLGPGSPRVGPPLQDFQGSFIIGLWFSLECLVCSLLSLSWVTSSQGTIHRVSAHTIRVSVRRQLIAAMLISAFRSPLLLRTYLGGNKEGAIIMATLCADILLVPCCATRCAMNISRATNRARFSGGNSNTSRLSARVQSGNKCVS
uniref:Uncharacterized protein n=1 Tax=Cacopsylla melanoneura TaxID=428564 RepID=A0A8D9AH63_9HEMI